METTSGTNRFETNTFLPKKAIVHVYLFGGLDSMNMLAPHPDGCPSLYEEYVAQRGNNLYLTTGEMIKIDINESAEDQPGKQNFLGRDYHICGTMLYL